MEIPCTTGGVALVPGIFPLLIFREIGGTRCAGLNATTPVTRFRTTLERRSGHSRSMDLLRRTSHETLAASRLGLCPGPDGGGSRTGCSRLEQRFPGHLP